MASLPVAISLSKFGGNAQQDLFEIDVRSSQIKDLRIFMKTTVTCQVCNDSYRRVEPKEGR